MGNKSKKKEENLDQEVQEEKKEELDQELQHDASEETVEKDDNGADQLLAMKEKYLRLVAEFDNYKKRTNRERINLMNTAGENTIMKLLPVLDDFDRAKHSADDDSSEEIFTEGVRLVYEKLHKVLNQMGLTVMESNKMEFNPELHEAITKIPVEDDKMKGKIVDTIEKGYKLHDKIIRHAKVVVGN